MALAQGDGPSALQDTDEIAKAQRTGIADGRALNGLPMHAEALALVEQAKHK